MEKLASAEQCPTRILSPLCTSCPRCLSKTSQCVKRPDRRRVSISRARNVSPFTVDPGKFTYRLVKGELEFSEYGQIFAHCRIDNGPWHLVPFTLLPPAA